MSEVPDRFAVLELPLDFDDLFCLWAALMAMVEDNHSPQDTMSPAQWEAAEKLCKRLTEVMDRRHSVGEV